MVRRDVFEFALSHPARPRAKIRALDGRKFFPREFHARANKHDWMSTRNKPEKGNDRRENVPRLYVHQYVKVREVNT